MVHSKKQKIKVKRNHCGSDGLVAKTCSTLAMDRSLPDPIGLGSL